jgi:hypothetical protein
MRRFAILLLLGIATCGKQADRQAQRSAKPAVMTSTTAAQSTMPGKTLAAMHFIAVPKDKAQLNRLLAMGYTVHNDHMHPPGVKECPLDKAGGSVVQ